MMSPNYPTTLTRARLAGRINKDDPALLSEQEKETFYQNRRAKARSPRDWTAEARQNRYKGKGQ